MATLKNKQDDDNLKTLREMVAIGSNRTCFDCGQRGPTYVNMTVGSFVCTSCSGRLRGLTPPHRVKSISMATFTSDEINFIKSRGNDFCRKVWLGKHDSPMLNATSSAEESQLIEELIQKYEKKRWYVAPTEDMYDEAKRLNTSCPVKKTEVTLLSQASQMTTSRSIPNISTQSIQRPTAGNVRAIPGVPRVNPTSSLPQSPVKTPKTTAAPSVWGVQESPSICRSAGGNNFANFASFSSNISSPSPGYATGSPPFSAFSGSAKEVFQFPAGGYKPPVPSDRYAALAELDFTRSTGPPGAYNWDINVDPGAQPVASHHLPSSGATNPFMLSTSAAASSLHAQADKAGANQFAPVSHGYMPAYPPGVCPVYGNVPAQTGAYSSGVWSGSMEAFPYGGQQFSVTANPFLNMTRQNVTNPFL